MTRNRLLRLSEAWFRSLQRFYPPDFRDEMGRAAVETYLDRARDALARGGTWRLGAVWARALADSLRNGAGERFHPAASWRRTGNWGRDLELARRRLTRSPLFAATTTTTLAIGLGMFAVAYTAVQKILLDPMPYRDPGDLYYVWRDYTPVVDVPRGTLAGTDILELQKSNAVIQDAAALRAFLGGIFAPREGAESMEVAVTQTSPNLFAVLGVAPRLGRAFAPGEFGPGRADVMILTHHLWTRLGADPAIVGQDVRLQGRPFRVVGVLSRDFTFVRNDATAPPQPVDAFVPFDTFLGEGNPRNNGYAAVLRARPGSSPAAVAAAVGAVGRVIDARDFHGRGLRLFAVGLKSDVLVRIRPALVVLAAAGVVLVFMLMLNLASVLLARGAQRRHELAVSRALGANTAAIVRATLLEGGILGLGGGALGALAAIWATRALVALTPLDLPRREGLVIDWQIGVVVTAIGAILGLLAALAPAIWAARTSLSALLAGSAVRGGGGPNRLRRSMVVAQVALSLVLLSSGALVARSFETLLRVDPGFRPEGVLTMRVRTPPEFYAKLEQAFAFQDRVQRALAAVPGVTSAGAATSLPLTGNAFQATIGIPGAPGNSGVAERDAVLTDMLGVRPNFIETIGIRLLAGRTFAESRPAGALEVVIDAALAQRFFPQGSPLGATMRLGQRSFTIIGVMNPVRLYDVHAGGRPQILVRSEDLGTRPLYFVARTTRDPHSILPEVRAAVRRLDSRVPVGEERSLEEIVQASLAPQAIGGSLISAFAASALLLAAMGLFGVVSGSVTRRRHELAVRLALGAGHGRVLRLVMQEGAILVFAGLIVGAPGIWFANGLICGLVVGVSPSDPPTLLAAAFGLWVVTMVTCYLPARRTLRIDPAGLLRQE